MLSTKGAHAEEIQYERWHFCVQVLFLIVTLAIPWRSHQYSSGDLYSGFVLPPQNYVWGWVSVAEKSMRFTSLAWTTSLYTQEIPGFLLLSVLIESSVNGLMLSIQNILIYLYRGFDDKCFSIGNNFFLNLMLYQTHILVSKALTLLYNYVLKQLKSLHKARVSSSLLASF